MRASEIKHWDARARERFGYLADVGDTWRSHADAVLRGEAWSGDCDDLASTALDLLGRAGLALDQQYRLEVDSKGGSQVNHLVACVVDDAGGLWIVGDTFGVAYRAGGMMHAPIQYQHMSELPTVRLGAPWTAKA